MVKKLSRGILIQGYFKCLTKFHQISLGVFMFLILFVMIGTTTSAHSKVVE